MAQIQRFGNRPNIAESTFRGFKQGEDIANRGVRDRASQMGLDQKQAELDRFQEDSNLKSMVQGALEFTKIDPQDNQAQIQFLQSRAEEINARGGDPRDTLELIEMPMSQRPEVIQSVLTIGERAGIIKPQQQNQKLSKVQTFQQGLIDAGIDPNSEQGRKATQDFAIGKKTPLVTVNTGEKAEGARQIAEAKAIGGFQGKRIEGIITDGENATTQLQTLNQLENINVEKGLLEGSKLSLARVLDGVGLKNEARKLVDLDAGLSMQFLSNKMTNDIVAGFKGVQTDNDVARVRATMPTIQDTQVAFKFKINSLKSTLLRAVQKQEFVENQIDSGVSPSKAIREWNKFISKTPSLGMVKTMDSTIPTFFFQYRNAVKKGNPALTEQEIIDGWETDAK